MYKKQRKEELDKQDKGRMKKRGRKGEEEKRRGKKEDTDEKQRVGTRSYQEIKIIRLEKEESVLDTCYFSIFFSFKFCLVSRKFIITWN